MSFKEELFRLDKQQTQAVNEPTPVTKKGKGRGKGRVLKQSEAVGTAFCETTWSGGRKASRQQDSGASAAGTRPKD